MTNLITASNRSARQRWFDGHFWRFVRTQPFGTAGLLIIIAMAVAGIFAPYIAPYDPVAVDFRAMLSPPSSEHWLGTDSFGRDILSRIIYGARTALAVGILSASVGCVAGAILGVAAAYFGGQFDIVVQSIVDILLSFPIIVLALVIAAVLGKAMHAGVDVNLIAAIAIPMIPKVERVVRSSALSIREKPYIEAARIAEYSHARIIFIHITPNVMAPFLIMFTSFTAQAILTEATLSFLGLGASEPDPSWGLMLAGSNADVYRRAPWVVIVPGIAISLAVLAFNILGDALRDRLDPRLRV